MSDTGTTDTLDVSRRQTAALAALCKRLNYYVVVYTVAIAAAVVSFFSMIGSTQDNLKWGLAAILATMIAIGTRQIIYLARITYKLEYPDAPPPVTGSRTTTE